VARVGLWLFGLGLVLCLAGCRTTGPVTAAPNTDVTVSAADRARFADNATWAPGQLAEHFDKHPEDYRSVQDYDRGARDTVRSGVAFTYVDREAGVERLGFYEPRSNRFTSLTRDGRRITTHFRPDRGAAYVQQLPESTYR
jgi:pyocin large subunit-like protein